MSRTPGKRSETLLSLIKLARACRALGHEESRAGRTLGRGTAAYDAARETARETVRGILGHPGDQTDASMADDMLHDGPTETPSVETTRVPVLDLARMATRADTLGKAESEHWYDVPEHKRARVLEVLKDRNDAFRVLSENESNVLAAEATIDGRLYRLSYRETARLQKPVLMFMSAGRGAYLDGRDTVVAAMRPREDGATPVILTIPLTPAPGNGGDAES